MGIPKFYRWLSERYPLLNMPVTAAEAPPGIDNLYLDMNGIIHNCTHANDPNLKLTETEMILRIFNYLDKLIQIMKPKKLVFLAIDGVAPRAKMNQQRSRRFKSALERIAREAEQKAQGNEVPDEYKFDSNCITPGTAFMARLGKHLRFFIRKKISEDTVWQQPVVMFSGHDVPGEGEHKIMEYIRWHKRSPGYTPNQRHCMYGLDADLIMLSLVTHEPHFCLLREVVSFTGKNRGQPSRETLENPCAENFILFQIGLLREYIELEFTSSLADKRMTYPLDIERVIDDIILFCMLVGNDFLPALPTLDIAEGALNKLIDVYKQLLPQLGGYLTHAGDLNHERLQVMLGVLADAELQTLEERAADTEWFESKRAKQGGRGRGGSRPQTARSGVPSTREQQQQPVPLASTDDWADADLLTCSGGTGGAAEPVAAALAAVVPAIQGLGLEELEPDEPEAGPTMMSKEARAMFLNGGGEAALQAWKERYYREKLEVRDASPASTCTVVHHYIRGLHWVLQYYYKGVASWDWFYPYHYAPMASDMRNLDGIEVRFTRGRPFQPFEQLLAVLPAASSSLLPEPFQWLMTDGRSPIIDFYPEKFDIDMEGKRAEWEGIVKVPFINQQRLLAAAASVPLASLTAEERKRNVPGDILIFQFASGHHELEHCDSTLPRQFSNILQAHSHCSRVPPPPPIPPADKGFVPMLAKGTFAGKKNPPGFPTLKTMSGLVTELKNAGVNVFANPSKKDSLILQLPNVHNTIAADAAAPLLRGMLCGRVYVKWPYLQEAEIVAVSDARQRISIEGITQHTQEASGKWQMVAGQTKNMFLTKSGIDIGPLPILLDVRVCTGYIRAADGSIRKEYSRELAPYPLQAVLQSRPKPPPGFADPDAPQTLSLQPGSKAIWLGANYFGCLGTVIADPAAKVAGRQSSNGYVFRVQPVHQELLQAEGRARHIVQQFAQEFFPSGLACRQLGVNPRMLGRLTGNVWVEDSQGQRVDVGLAVKNAKQGLCVPTLCRPAPEGTGWSYSKQLIEIVRQYKAHFPSVLAALEPSASAAAGSADGGDQRQRVSAAALFPGVPANQLDTKLGEVRAWLKGLPSSKRPLVSMTAQQASDLAVDRLQLALPGLLPAGARTVGPVELEQVYPNLLLPPHDPACPVSELAGGTFEPGDRVVVLRGTGAPAFGARGTIIGVLPDGLEVLLDQESPGASTLGGRLRSARGAYLPAEQLLNVSKQLPITSSRRPYQAAASAFSRSQKEAAAVVAADTAAQPPAATIAARRLEMLAPWIEGRQMQQHPEQRCQESVKSDAAASEAAAAGQGPSITPVAPTTQGSRLLQLLKKGQPHPQLQHEIANGSDQQQQQQQRREMIAPVVKASQPAAGVASSAPSAAAGRSLLHKLQKGSAAAAGQRALNGLHQQVATSSAVSAAATTPCVPVAALHHHHQQQQSPELMADGAQSTVTAPVHQRRQQQSHSDNQQGSAGAQLLAMLQQRSSANTNGSSALQQAVGAAAVAATEQQQQEQHATAQPQQAARQLQVRVVPRPTTAQQQQQQQLGQAEPMQQGMKKQQQAQQTPPEPEQVSSVANKPEARATDQPEQQAAASAAGPASDMLSWLSVDGAGVKPRTPPAGAGYSLLLNRGQAVIQARIPDGTRGFTLGRGQQLPAATDRLGGPAAPGSKLSNTMAAGTVRPTLPPTPTVLRLPGMPAAGAVGSGQQLSSGPASAAQPLKADIASLSSRTAGTASNGDFGSAATGAGPSTNKLLQQGADTSAEARTPVLNQGGGGRHQQQQLPTGTSAAAGPSPSVMANITAASNLLRRLQSQQSTLQQ